MKILKHGSIAQDVEVVCTCNRCHCKFQFSRKEGKLVHDPRDGDAVLIACPECKNTNWISVSLFDRQPG